MNLKDKVIFVLSNPIFYFTLAALYTFFLIINHGPDTTTVIFSLSSFLLILHILYGGYFLFRNGKVLDPVIATSSIAVLISMFYLTSSIQRPYFWFISLTTLFMFAIIYHQRTRFLSDVEYIKEFCNYKTYIEIQGIIGSLIGATLLIAFPNSAFLISIFNILGILKLNHTILFKKNLYRIKYSNPSKLNNPLVSMIIITYNEEKNIGKLLDSIRSQSYKRLEVIIVDDHSSDRTCEIAKRFSRSLKLKVVKKDIRGQSRSRNFGAKFARGKVLLFLDGDVSLPKDFLKSNLEEFLDKKLSIAFSDYKGGDKDMFEKILNSFYRVWLKTVQYYNPRAIGFSIWARKAIHDRTLFDPSIIMSEDFDYINRASKKGKFRILSSCPIDSDSISRRFDRENKVKLILKYLYFETYRNFIGEIRRPLAQYNYDRGDGKVLSIDNQRL